MLHHLYYIIGAVARTGAAFGQGSEPTLLDNVRCNGLESRLFDCEHNGIENENCDHNQDVGVICQTGMIVISYEVMHSEVP